ncbi:hypothetical protein pah_c249o006 [Parachlamydia acanthamoebae str. Hall's coccus]|nr:hypothetical protein pah_c249o006 [Parachlamydia acanthamoebae str. Hall's coccus]
MELISSRFSRLSEMNLNEKVVIFNYAAPAGRIDFFGWFSH